MMSRIKNRYERRSRTTSFLRNLSIEFEVPIWGESQQERKKTVEVGSILRDNVNTKK